MFDISNAEYMILSLINEAGQTSGYRINAIIAERGYRAWADIGTTSTYVSLKKLEAKTLVVGELIADKTTRGPAARQFSMTDRGTNLLKSETVAGLSRTRESDKRFNLALSTVPLLGWGRTIELLTERIQFLESESQRLSAILESQRGEIGIAGDSLFLHSLHSIASEITFTKELTRKFGEVKDGQG